MKLDRSTRCRYMVYALIVMVLFSSCNLSRRSDDEAQPGSGSVGSGVRLPEDQTAAPETQAPATDGPQAPKATPKRTSGGGDGGAHGDGPTIEPEVQRRQAQRYLNAAVPKLTVEVDYIEGAGPNAQAVAFARNYLAQFIDKPQGFDFVMSDAIPKRQDTYTGSDIEALRARYRTSENSKDVAAIHIIYVNGRCNGCARQPAGSAGGDEMTMWADVIENSGNQAALYGRYEVERAVLIHEFGHLLGLVDNRSSPRKRPDPNDPAHDPPNSISPHSKNPNSVMYWRVNSPDIALFFRDAPNTEFDGDDRADLDDIKNGRW